MSFLRLVQEESNCILRTDQVKFTYLGSSVSFTETDVNTRLAKAWTAVDSLSVIWKSDLTDKIKRSFFQAAVVYIYIYIYIYIYNGDKYELLTRIRFHLHPHIPQNFQIV